MRPLIPIFTLALSSGLLGADTLQLRDDASISGRILAEKNESVAVDVGYTVLMVPRAAISKITTSKEAKEESKEPKGPNSTPPASAKLAVSLYQNPGALRKEG